MRPQPGTSTLQVPTSTPQVPCISERAFANAAGHSPSLPAGTRQGCWGVLPDSRVAQKPSKVIDFSVAEVDRLSIRQINILNDKASAGLPPARTLVGACCQGAPARFTGLVNASLQVAQETSETCRSTRDGRPSTRIAPGVVQRGVGLAIVLDALLERPVLQRTCHQPMV